MSESLLSPQGQAALDVAAAVSDPDSLHAAQLLRQQFQPELAALALTQERLRRKGVAKFGAIDARRLYFTVDGVEQATRPRVASWRARRIAATGVSGVIDLCCGIGSDALAIENEGLAVVAVELDERTATFAAANLNADSRQAQVRVQVTWEDGFSQRAQVICGDAVQLWPTLAAAHPDWAVFIDPARRVQGKGRSWCLDDMQPNWQFVRSLLSSEHPCMVKLGPGFPQELIPDDVDAAWVSDAGDLVELCLSAPGNGRREAIVLGADGQGHSLTAQGLGQRVDETLPQIGRTAQTAQAGQAAQTASTAHPPQTAQSDRVESDELGETEQTDLAREADVDGEVHYILEPDPAVSRAGLSDAVAPGHAWRLSEHAGYLASEQPIITPFATCFEVLEVLPFNEKTLRAWVKATGTGVLEIKKRGIDLDPAVLRRKLRPVGVNQATFIIAPTSHGTSVFVVRRVPPRISGTRLD